MSALSAAAAGVHGALLRRFVWAPDAATFQRREHWSVLPWADHSGPLMGDCDDFALTACDMLLRLHAIPKAALRLHFCRTETDEGHLVASVVDGVSETVIDNRQRSVWALRSLRHYAWISFRQLDWPPLHWRETVL